MRKVNKDGTREKCSIRNYIHECERGGMTLDNYIKEDIGIK